MTAAYTQPDWNKPVGSDTGPNVPTKARDNLRALRDGLLTGKVKDWTFERVNGSGSADEPQYWRFKNTVNSIWFRMTNTWTSSKITSQLVEWSDDGGSTWATVMSGDTIVYDGNLNITSQSVGSGIYVFILELIAKTKKIASDLAAHIAAAGTAVHGLGTMSTQNKTGVDIDGGTVDGTDVGNSARAKGSFTRLAEDVNSLSPGLNAGVTLDWSYGGTSFGVNGVHTITMANVPTGLAGHMLGVSNFDALTWPGSVSWGVGGRPSINGNAVISLVTFDGGTSFHGAIFKRDV